jgi:SAM-dependent methyltransferase
MNAHIPGHTLTVDVAAEVAGVGWFSPMELAPGVYTVKGDKIPYWTMAINRKILERANVRGMKCLDFGAVDGYTAALLSRLGAKHIVAVDAADYSRQIDIVKRALNISFDYLPRVRSLEIVNRMMDYHKLRYYFADDAGDDFGFDIVVCAGVLYHLYSPLHMIGALRTLVRPGGLVLIETAVIPDEKSYMSFNYLGGPHYIYAHSDTWFFTPPLLDYILRLFSLRPLDIIYRTQKPIDEARSVGRAVVICRAEDAPCARPDDLQMVASTSNYEFHELYRKELESLKKQVVVDYAPISAEDHGHLNLQAACVAQSGFPIPAEDAMLYLKDYVK